MTDAETEVATALSYYHKLYMRVIISQNELMHDLLNEIRNLHPNLDISHLFRGVKETDELIAELESY